MSNQDSAKCPFAIQPTRTDPDLKKNKSRFITFEVPIDAAEPNGIKIKHSALINTDTHPESILKHEVQFERLRSSLNLDNATKRKSVYEGTLGPDLLIKWRDACTQPPVSAANFDTLTLAEISAGREQFILKFMDRSISNNTKAWLSKTAKKPKDMSITDFTSRVSEIASYFPHMPRPRLTNPPTPRVQGPDQNDQITILENACPQS